MYINAKKPTKLYNILFEQYVSFWNIFFIFFGYMLGRGIAGSYSSSVFSFLSNFCAVFHSGCINFTHPPTVCKRSPFSTSLPAFVICGLLMMAVLKWYSVKWYCIAVFICAYLMIRDVEHLFTYLLAICLLRKNVCSGLLLIFTSRFFFLDIELYELFIYFGC